MDGKELKRDEDYTAESGSVIIHLTPKYLSTLEVDSHELEAMFDDATNRPVARFTIEEASDENDGPNGSDSSNGSNGRSAPSGPKSSVTTVRREALPYTGDNLWWWPFG